MLQESCNVSPLEKLLSNHAHMVHMLQWWEASGEEKELQHRGRGHEP